MATGALTIPLLAELAGRAALVLALAWIGARLAFRRSASTRYAVWAAGFIAAFALPIAAGLLPSWHLAVLPTPQSPSMVAQPIDSATSQASPSMPAPLREHRTTVPHTNDASARASAPRAQGAPAAPLPWALVAWVAIAAGLILRYVLSLLAVRWMTRQAELLTDRRWQDALDVAVAMLGLTRAPRLLASARVSVPFTCGLVRPALVVPASALAWDDERIHVVLLHELAHVVRRDCLLQAISHIVCALYWFNPLAWLGARQLRAERERACDDLVLASGTASAAYAQHLLDIARAATVDARPRLASAALAMARPSELEGRLLAILDPRRSRARAPHRVVWQVAGLAILIALPLATVRLVARAAAVPATDASPTGWANTNQTPPVPATTPPASPVATPREAPVRSQVTGGAVAGGVARGNSRRATAAVIAGAIDEAADMDNERESEGDVNQRTPSPAVVQALTEALKDSDAEVRKSALHALTRFRSPVAFDAYITALKDQDPEVREQAAFGLSQLRDDRATDALIAALKDENGDVRQQAAFALSQLRERKAVPALTAALKDVDEDVREQALFALSQIRDASSVPALIGALGDAKPDVRQQAAFALSQIGDAAAVPGLITALKDSDAEVRQQAAFALSQIGDESAIDALTAAVKDPVADVRQQAIFALTQIAEGHGRGRQGPSGIAPAQPKPEPQPKPVPPPPAQAPKPQ
jgi:HEAT repeat protein/beta-lactamase regulating signal transducer with metallopeptidase domain